MVEGISRAEMILLDTDDQNIPMATVFNKSIKLESMGDPEIEAQVYALRNFFDEFSERLPKLSSDLLLSVRSITAPGLLCDFIACNALVDIRDKQEVLEQFDPAERVRRLAFILAREGEIVKTGMDIREKVHAHIEKSQREYYLREQLKMIQSELGEAARDSDISGGFYDEDDSEISEYMEKIAVAKLPQEVEDKLIKETKKLAKTPYNSAEAGVLRNYLDICLEIPWNKKTKDRIDIESARKILDRDHDGLEKSQG